MNADTYRAAHTSLAAEIDAAAAALDNVASMALWPISSQFNRLPEPALLEYSIDIFGIHPEGYTYTSATMTAENLRTQLRAAISRSTTPAKTSPARTSTVSPSTAPPQRATAALPAVSLPDPLTTPPAPTTAPAAAPMAKNTKLMIAGLVAVAVGAFLWSRQA